MTIPDQLLWEMLLEEQKQTGILQLISVPLIALVACVFAVWLVQVIEYEKYHDFNDEMSFLTKVIPTIILASILFFGANMVISGIRHLYHPEWYVADKIWHDGVYAETGISWAETPICDPFIFQPLREYCALNNNEILF